MPNESVPVSINGRTIVLNSKNFKEALARIEAKLKPGTPVLLQNEEKNIGMMRPLRSSSNILFLSGGRLSQDGKFNILQGKRNYAYAEIFGSDGERRTYQNFDAELSEGLTLPRSWSASHYNEGTFSPSGGSTSYSFHSRGTIQVTIGDSLEEKFPATLRAIRFVGDAIPFTLSGFYSSGVADIWDTNEKMDERNKAEYSHARKNTLHAILNLLSQAAKSDELRGKYAPGLIARKLTTYIKGGQGFREEGKNINDEDYIVNESEGQGRYVGFIKNENIGQVNLAYVLPANRLMTPLVKLALSPKMIRKYYPLP